MPLISNTKKKAFKKKAYRPWDLLGAGEVSDHDQSPWQDSAEIETTNRDKQRQDEPQIETNRDNTLDVPILNRDNKSRQIETRARTRAVQGGKRQSPAAAAEATVSVKPDFRSPQATQEVDVSILATDCPHLQETLSSFDAPSERGVSPFVSISSPSRPYLEIETTNGDKWGQSGALPTSNQQLRLLAYLVARQLETGLDHTARLSTTTVAQLLDIPVKGLRKQLMRLVAAGLVIRLDGRRGRGDSGTVYQVPNAVRRQIENSPKWRHLIGTNGDKTSPIEIGTTPVSSSRSTNTSTTSDKIFSQTLQSALDTLGLQAFGIGANDVLDLWRRRSLAGAPLFASENDLLQSIEHLAFYLGLPEARSIKSPKAWFMATLRKGYYPPPAGFVSFEEKQERLKLEAAQQRLAQLRAVKRQQFQLEFQIWLEELSPEERRQHLSGTFVENPHSIAAKHILLGVFAQVTGRELPPEDDEAPQERQHDAQN